jgi:hypothetical protein
MNAEFEPACPGPLLLLGKAQESLHLLSQPLLGKRCSVVRTVGEAAVETMASILKPAAVLLEASELYLEGRTILSRLRERSGDSRVIFLDVEGPWALFMEFESGNTNDLRVLPCAVDALGETLMELLESGRPGTGGEMNSDLAETGPEDADDPELSLTPAYAGIYHTIEGPWNG